MKLKYFFAVYTTSNAPLYNLVLTWSIIMDPFTHWNPLAFLLWDLLYNYTMEISLQYTCGQATIMIMIHNLAI